MTRDGRGLAGGAFLVTAGASGIGRAVALHIARAGGDVAIVDIDAATGADAAAEARSHGVAALNCPADVRDRPGLEAAAGRAERELGPLRGLVAAAGLSIPSPAAALTRAAWDAVIGVSLTGCFNACQTVGRKLIANGGGAIVTIASGDAIGAQAGRAGSCAANFGVIGLTRTLAIEWGRHGVRVNAVAAGMADTPAVRRGAPVEQIANVLLDRIALGRLARPDEIGSACAFLLSDRAAYVTGMTMAVDGGLSAGFVTRWQGRDLASLALLEAGAYAVPDAAG